MDNNDDIIGRREGRNNSVGRRPQRTTAVATLSATNRRFVSPVQENGAAIRQRQRQHELSRQLHQQQSVLASSYSGANNRIVSTPRPPRPTTSANVQGHQGLYRQQQQHQRPTSQQQQQQHANINNNNNNNNNNKSRKRCDVRQEEMESALAKATLSALRSPNGEIEPNLLIAAINAGLPKDGILETVRVAREEKEAAKKKRKQAETMELSTTSNKQQATETKSTTITISIAKTYVKTN